MSYDVKMKAYLDYLRVATWDFSEYAKLSSQLLFDYTNWRDGAYLQYRGRRNDEMFFGMGLQAGQRHYMAQCSGAASINFFDYLSQYPSFYATRLDVQCTILKPESYSGLETYQRIKKDGTVRNSSIIISPTGSTVYLGNRMSDSFARIYEKEIDGEDFLRLEFEIKGNTAKRAYKAMLEEGHTATQIFDGISKRFWLPGNIMNWFILKLDENGTMITAERDKNKNDRLNWLLNLQDTIIKMGNDHTIGGTVVTFLHNCLEAIDNDD